MQQLLIVGRLGQDCKVHEYSGKKFVSFSVAVDDDYKDASGNKVDRTAWYDCTQDNTAVAPYLKKGTQVLIQGKPKVETYTSDRDGKTYAKCRVQVRTLQLLGSAAERTTSNDLPAPTAPAASRPAPAPSSVSSIAADDENDLPF